MPCKKFISIRFQPKIDDPISPQVRRAPRIYIDDMTMPQKREDLTRFTLQSLLPDGVGMHTNEGSTVTIEAMRWPPMGYDSPIALSLNAKWPFEQDCYDKNDRVEEAPDDTGKGRSFAGVNFIYDEEANTLSWNQENVVNDIDTLYSGKLRGSVEFNTTTPIWYVVLRIDPKAINMEGEMIIDGVDISTKPISPEAKNS